MYISDRIGEELQDLLLQVPTPGRLARITVLRTMLKEIGPQYESNHETMRSNEYKSGGNRI